MKEAPRGFALDRLAHTLAVGWGIRARQLEYLPCGFGAYHWRVTDISGSAYFLALHDLGDAPDDTFETLACALRTAYWLHTFGELEFVLAPVRDRASHIVYRYGRAEGLAVYPWLECRPRTDLDHPDVGRLLTRLHLSTGTLPPDTARSEDFRIPRRAELEAALAELDRDWDAGPYGERARVRLHAAAEPTHALLALYDRLAAQALVTRSDWVITHGEPYGLNLVETDAGRTMLVDWDSALRAPRERDLWEIPWRSPALGAYIETAGVRPRADLLRLYRAWYHLAETAIYIHQFRHPHTGDLNDAEAWANFLFHLPTYENWPELR